MISQCKSSKSYRFGYGVCKYVYGVTFIGKPRENVTTMCIENILRLRSTNSLRFMPVGYEYKKMSYISENNNKSKQFSRLDTWKIAARPAKFRIKAAAFL